MAKRRKIYKKSSKCPEPFNMLVDLAGAATLGAYVKHKIKKDYARGEGEESAKAASIVFGTGSLRRGSSGLINLGGLIGLNSALKEIDKNQREAPFRTIESPFVDKVSDTSLKTTKPLRKNLWREHCEDGTAYNIDPMDYNSADEYEEALLEAKSKFVIMSAVATDKPVTEASPSQIKYTWRKYCSNGSKYGLSPEDYENADDYEEALEIAKLAAKNSSIIGENENH